MNGPPQRRKGLFYCYNIFIYFLNKYMKAVQSKIGRKIFSNRASGREVLNAIRNKGIAIIKIGSNALILSK